MTNYCEEEQEEQHLALSTSLVKVHSSSATAVGVKQPTTTKSHSKRSAIKQQRDSVGVVQRAAGNGVEFHLQSNPTTTNNNNHHSKKKHHHNIGLVPINTNLKQHQHHLPQHQAIPINSNHHHHTNAKMSSDDNNKEHVNNNNNNSLIITTTPPPIQPQPPNYASSIQAQQPHLQASASPSDWHYRSRSVSSSGGGLDEEDIDVNHNNKALEQQYGSPCSTPRMFSPSSTLNFAGLSPVDFPQQIDSPTNPNHHHHQMLPQSSSSKHFNHHSGSVGGSAVVEANSSSTFISPTLTHGNTSTTIDHLHHQHQQHNSEHETAADLTSVDTHDSEVHSNVHSNSFKTVALSTSSSVNNSSPAIEIHHHHHDADSKHTTRPRSKSSQFNRPLERAHTAPNISRKEKHKVSTKYGQSEYKTFVKHTIKLKEVGDMRVRGISLKYETNYHEFLEEAIPHKTFVNEMTLLNQFLKNNEPGAKYCCLGFTFFCCTLGLSMIPFAYQLSHFENAVEKYLDELNKKYASVHVNWKLIPSTTPSDESYIVVSLEREIDSKDLEKLEIS